MEHLTEKRIGGPFAEVKGASPVSYPDYDTFWANSMAVNRLYEYEQTGLTPEEVHHIKITLRNNGYKHINEMLMAISHIRRERDQLRDKLAAVKTEEAE